MANRLSPAGKRALTRFLALLCAAAAVQAVSLLGFFLEGDGGVALYALGYYGLMPAAAVIFPWWAALGGVHPLAACLPVGGLGLVIGLSPSPLLCLLCVLLSLIAACSAQEWNKRHGKEIKKQACPKRRKKKSASS